MTEPKPQVLLVHPGTQYAPHLARELSAQGMLHRFWTGFALAEQGWAARLLKLCPAIISCRFGKRMMQVSSSKLRTLPLLDWRARKASRSVGEEAAFFERNRRFQEAIPDPEVLAADVVIGFDTSAWLLGRRAKAMKRIFILDQSIGHPAAKERIFESLRQRFPEWSTSAPKKSAEIVAVEREEHALADVIVVPSDFVKQTLVAEGVDESKIRIIPFGTDLTLFHPPEKRGGKTVVFLFVGGLTARKGLPLIATHESGAADLIQEGSNGFLIRAGDMEALAERIQRLAQDATLRQQMQQAALTARDRLSWQIYGGRWSTLLKEI